MAMSYTRWSIHCIHTYIAEHASAYITYGDLRPCMQVVKLAAQVHPAPMDTVLCGPGLYRACPGFWNCKKPVKNTRGGGWGEGPGGMLTFMWTCVPCSSMLRHTRGGRGVGWMLTFMWTCGQHALGCYATRRHLMVRVGWDVNKFMLTCVPCRILTLRHWCGVGC